MEMVPWRSPLVHGAKVGALVSEEKLFSGMEMVL
jgi:hypothetical protein